jgi:prophage DNA circulation protein
LTWKDQLGRVDFQGRQLIGASFRGVSFFVDTAERSGGRRTVTHEYPKRNEPFVEDLGRSARGFAVEGYVIGPDYLAQRDALLDALETEGSGQLVHPYHGVLQVICTGYRVRESTAEGGLARFGLDFAQTETSPRQPTAALDATALLDTSATAAATAAGEDFLVAYVEEGQPPWAMEAISALLAGVGAQMDELLSPVVQDAQALATLKGELATLLDDADRLVQAPVDAVAQLQEVFASLLSDVLQPRAGLAALLVFATTEPTEPRPEGSTTTRVRQQANYDALLALVRRGAIAQAARLAPLETYDSYEDAVGVRDQIAAALDEQLETAGDEAFSALQQLRADLVRSVPGEESDLARLVSYTPPASAPSLALAYRLYGSLDLESDLLARNHVQHPCFVPGGQPLEVLSGG